MSPKYYWVNFIDDLISNPAQIRYYDNEITKDVKK